MLLKNHMNFSFFYLVKRFWTLAFPNLIYERKHSLLTYVQGITLSLVSLPRAFPSPALSKIPLHPTPSPAVPSHAIGFLNCYLGFLDLLSCFYLMSTGLLTGAVSLLTSSVPSCFVPPSLPMSPGSSPAHCSLTLSV